jgi:hypothetical protein
MVWLPPIRSSALKFAHKFKKRIKFQKNEEEFFMHFLSVAINCIDPNHMVLSVTVFSERWKAWQSTVLPFNFLKSYSK